jgi:hypothetical protein
MPMIVAVATTVVIPATFVCSLDQDKNDVRTGG